MLSKLRSQFHRKVIQRVGDQITQELARQLRTEAKQMSIPTEIADQLIEEEKQEIIDRLGNKYAGEMLDN